LPTPGGRRRTGEPVPVAWTVNVAEPATLGVPEMTPVCESRLSPLGRLPEVTDQLYEPHAPVADRATEYDEATTPPDRLEVATARGACALSVYGT